MCIHVRQITTADRLLDWHHLPPPSPSGPVLKICLQCLVCTTIVLRAVMLFGQLRRLWREEGHSLAAEFRHELRRRGLLAPRPRSTP